MISAHWPPAKHVEASRWPRQGSVIISVDDESENQKRERICLKLLGHVRLFATPWTVAQQAPLSMGFSRQEHWSGLPYPPPGDLPDPGIKPVTLMCSALAVGFFTIGATGT